MAQYKDFIPENVALPGTRRIGIYSSDGNRVGSIPLGSLTPPNPAQKLYSFGALSDIHLQYDTAQADFQRALIYLNETEDVAFTCIAGDLTDNGESSDLQTYANYVSTYSKDTPVYAITGNHDVRSGLQNSIATYTGKPLYYSFAHGDDIFIMMGVNKEAEGSLFTGEQLQWFYETLESNRNRRCFVFEHVNPQGSCGNAMGQYTYDIWGGTEATVFESLMKHYHNVILFHGHSHLKFYLQYGSDKANYDHNWGCHSVHIPSLAVPREDVTGDGKADDINAESEGYVVDVYENGIHLRGRDFVKGEFLPIASYWLDTTLRTIPEGTYTDSTGTIKTGKYTNWVPLSTEADGVTIYNGGLGYKDSYRIRSGGAEGAHGSASHTGFIKVKPGDIVRVSGFPFSDVDTANAINASNSSFANIGQLTPSYATGYGIFASTYNSYSWNSVVEEKTGVWKWIVPPVDSGVVYIRVSGLTSADGSKMIVTINEEIT